MSAPPQALAPPLMFDEILQQQLGTLGCAEASPPSPETWRKLLEVVSLRYQQDERARSLLERSIAVSAEERQELHTRLLAERDQFAHIFRWSPVGMARVEARGQVFAAVNPEFARILGHDEEAMTGKLVSSFVPAEEQERFTTALDQLQAGTRREYSAEQRFVHAQGTIVLTEFSASVVHDESGKPLHLVVVIEDITAWTQVQIELRHAQKLESVGRLAAGIAHEINTPIQYVANNVTFLRSAFADLLTLCDVYRKACAQAAERPLSEAELSEVEAAAETADLDYAREHVPRALAATEEGANRVAKIVQSMKSFAYPDYGEMTTADVNAALESTITVASNELKYVAQVKTEFGPLPPLPCFLGDLNQVFLNLLVNAAHAISDVVGTSGQKGIIGVKTAVDGDHVLVTISDSGTGIPTEVRGRIYDPFFTTKEVGKGTGQGLALARAVVVERHGGSIRFDTELGKGTTFYLRLPLRQEGAPLA